MSILTHFLLSLFLTTFFGFTAPIILVGGILGIFAAMASLPGLVLVGEAGSNYLIGFLAIFGTGCPVTGVIILGICGSIVGGLFDTFNFYCHQNPSWRNQ